MAIIKALLLSATWLLVEALPPGESVAPHEPMGSWRLLNSELIPYAWRLRSLQFFSDLECMVPIIAAANYTGDAFATEASEMTGPDYVFSLQSMRGWESKDACKVGECHVGFTFRDGAEHKVHCILVHQGETGLHASGFTLQQRAKETDEWREVMTWAGLEGGRTKLAIECPAVPNVEHAKLLGHCTPGADHMSQECNLQCDDGYGAVEQVLRCMRGAWYMPRCLPIGSMIRLVAQAPALIKPYWVVLDAALYEKEDCTGLIRMNGEALSSGEYVIKYASYHPKNVWDSDKDTSWAAKDPCTPGSCYFGFRYRQQPEVPVRCVKIEHPHGSHYQATEVTLEQLGHSGWETVPDVVIQLLPEQKVEL